MLKRIFSFIVLVTLLLGSVVHFHVEQPVEQAFNAPALANDSSPTPAAHLKDGVERVQQTSSLVSTCKHAAHGVLGQCSAGTAPALQDFEASPRDHTQVKWSQLIGLVDGAYSEQDGRPPSTVV